MGVGRCLDPSLKQQCSSSPPRDVGVFIGYIKFRKSVGFLFLFPA